MKRTITAVVLAMLVILSLPALADTGHLHSAIPVLKSLTEKPSNKALLGELRFLIHALEDTPENRPVKAALTAVFALGQLRAGHQEAGLASCRKMRTDFGDSEFTRMVDPAKLQDPAKPGAVSETQVQRQFDEALRNSLALVIKTAKQTQVDTVKAKTLVTRSAFRKAGEKGPEPRPFVPTVLAGEPEQGAAYVLLDRSTANMFDGLVYLSKHNRLNLAIDPEILPMLAELKVGLPKLVATKDYTSLAALLEPHSLVVRKAAVSPNNQTAFITTPALWAYSTACRLLEEDNLSGAYAALQESGTDTTDFANHAAKFKETIASTVRNRKALETASKDVRDLLAVYRRAKATYESSQISAPTGLARGDGKALTASSSASRPGFERALKNVESCRLNFEDAVRSLEESQRLLVSRFNDTLDAHLYTEAVFILDYLVEKKKTIDDVVKAFETDKFELGIQWTSEAGIPAEIEQTQTRLAERVSSAATRATSAQTLLLSNRERAAAEFSLAFNEDRANPDARVGVGYCVVRHHLQSLAAVFEQNWANGELASILARDGQRLHKEQLLRALNFVTYGDTPLLAAASGGATVDPVVGSAIAAAQGAASPLTVRFQAMQRPTRRRGKTPPADPYWNSIQLNQTDDQDLESGTVTFGDSGGKDTHMLLSAQEAYSWLIGSYAKALKGKGLHIELPLLQSTQAGYSVGVPIALAGFSCAANTPLRQDVATAGALHSNGSVHAVESASEKVAGAVSSDRIEIVILPRANEADLMFVPVDYLCQVIVLTADEIGAYQQYVQDPTYRRELMDKVREAQVLTLLGQFESAKPVLLEAANRHPELYGARRLLELIALYGEE